MIWGKLLAYEEFLEKIVQFRWLGNSTSLFPSQLEELRIVCITDQDSSWMEIISKSKYISNIMLMRKLFLQTFCK